MSNEADDSSFIAIFPLPFRVLFLVGLGIWGWGANLHGLYLLGIDAANALDLRPRDSPDGALTPLPISRSSSQRGFKFVQDPASYYAPVYRLAGFYTVFCTISWMLYRYATFGDVAEVNTYKYIPALCALGICMGLISPLNTLQKPLSSSIRRCLFPPSGRPIYFSDVVFADVFTSFAKVLGDVWLSVCMLMPGGSILELPQQEGWTRWVLPALMSLPYLVRFRQCMIEWTAPSNESKRPLFNAIKYASSFPVIFLSAAQRIVVSDLVKEKGDHIKNEAWHGEHTLFRLWLLTALVNSLYSFWWDVTNDWGFSLLLPSWLNPPPKPSRPTSLPRPLVLATLHERAESLTSVRTSVSTPTTSPSGLSPQQPTLDSIDGAFKPPLSHLRSHSPLLPLNTTRPSSTNLNTSQHPHSHPQSHHQHHPLGLRHPLLFPLPIYPFIIFLDLVLRLTWSIKLSTHLHAHVQGEGSALIFWVEVAEVLRRWVWVFVRVEWEVVKRGLTGAAPGTGREIVDWDERDEEEDERVEGEQEYELEEDRERERDAGAGSVAGRGYGMNGYSGGDSEGPFDVVFEAESAGQDGKARVA